MTFNTTSIPKQITNLFSPPKLPEQKDLTFQVVAEAVNRQRIARITKAAIFALSSIIGTITLVLTEASIIAWPLALPAILVSLATCAIFFRLNRLDQRYVEGIDDKTRSFVVKNELDRILLSKEPFSPEEVKKSLKTANRILGNEAFDKEIIAKILLSQKEANLSTTPKSIAEVAFEKDEPLSFSSTLEWIAKGHYGLPSYEYKLEVEWNGNPETPLNIEYSSKEVTS